MADLRSDLRSDVVAALGAFTRETHAEQGRRRAAVGLVLGDAGDGRPSFLLTRRASRLRNHAGQWALPGGRADEGEDAAAAARREVAEEVGLDLPGDAVLGLLDDYPTRSGFVISPVVLWAGSRLGAVRAQAGEVASVYRIPLDDLDVEPRFVTIPESDRPVIQLPLLGSLIHAPTGAIVYQFAEVVLRGRATRVAGFEQPTFAWR